jgi:hypothetical protein
MQLWPLGTFAKFFVKRRSHGGTANQNPYCGGTKKPPIIPPDRGYKLTKFTRQVLKVVGEAEMIVLRLASLIMLLYLVWRFIDFH